MRTSSVLVVTSALLSAPLAKAQGLDLDQPVANNCAVDVVVALGDQGEWSTLPNYGPAWHPREDVVGPEFVPYVTGGAWILRDGRPYFQSRWPWGEVVFSSGNWTFTEQAGWLWLPDGRCFQPHAEQVPDPYDDMMPLPPLLNPIKVRVIKHPPGTTYAYPYGREWGRVLPEGVAAPVPRWMAPVRAHPGVRTHTNLMPNPGQ
jgi:hypothetical protein